jgi:hypothetical protein
MAVTSLAQSFQINWGEDFLPIITVGTDTNYKSFGNYASSAAIDYGLTATAPGSSTNYGLECVQGVFLDVYVTYTLAPAVNYGGAPFTPYSNVFAMQDALQSTVPVYLYIGYEGNASGGAGQFWTCSAGFTLDCNDTPLYILCPHGGNGLVDSGITGNYSENCYFSASANRACMALGEGPDMFANCVMNIERTHDANGNDTAEGFIFQIMQPLAQGPYGFADGGTINPSFVNMVVPFNGVRAGANSTFNAPINEASTTLSNGTQKGVLPITPFNFRPYNPGFGLMLYCPADAPAYTPISILGYDGVEHTYMPLNHGGGLTPTNPSPSTPMALLLRYE